MKRGSCTESVGSMNSSDSKVVLLFLPLKVESLGASKIESLCNVSNATGLRVSVAVRLPYIVLCLVLPTVKLNTGFVG